MISNIITPKKKRLIVKCRSCKTLYVVDPESLEKQKYVEPCPVCDSMENRMSDTIPLWKFNLIKLYRGGFKENYKPEIPSKKEKPKKKEKKQTILRSDGPSYTLTTTDGWQWEWQKHVALIPCKECVFAKLCDDMNHYSCNRAFNPHGTKNEPWFCCSDAKTKEIL